MPAPHLAARWSGKSEQPCFDFDANFGKVYGGVLSIWKDYGIDVTGGSISCGYYVTEEAREETYDRFMKFFAV